MKRLIVDYSRLHMYCLLGFGMKTCIARANSEGNYNCKQDSGQNWKIHAPMR